MAKGLQKLYTVLKGYYEFAKKTYIAFDSSVLIGHAKAKGEELDIYADAVARNNHMLGGIHYSEKGGWELWGSCGNAKTEEKRPLSALERAQLRISSEAIRGQVNIDAVTASAADVLKDASSPEYVGEFRFR